jgi:hypothetical protein
MQPKLRSSLAFGASFVATVILTSPARADAIDGQWCSPEGKHLTIEGRRITTPGGAKMEGDYSRHAFSYVVPANEAPAGGTIYMSLVNETTVLVREGTPVAQPVTWKRCQNIT